MTFEDLDVWKQARTLVNAIYTLTRRESLARDFGLCGQLQRAAVSVMTNVAEGFERSARAGEASVLQCCPQLGRRSPFAPLRGY